MYHVMMKYTEFITRLFHLTVLVPALFLVAAAAFAAEQEGVVKIAEKIPDALIPVFSNNGTRNAVLVDKAEQRLYLYACNKSGSFQKVFEFECSTGKSPGAKNSSGDAKTPEGLYFFIDKHPKRDLSPIYGIMAFPTDYPNLLDRMAGRTGNAIWLHGTNKPLQPMDSNGCVVLRDRDISRLDPYIELNRTPIIISKKISFIDYRSDIGLLLTGLLNKWNQAVSTGTYHDYLSFYDPEYLPDINWWPEWLKVREKLDEYGSLSFSSSRISFFKNDSVYVALFDHDLTTSGKLFRGGLRKLFFIRKGAGFTIVGDSYQAPPENVSPSEKIHPFPAFIRTIDVHKEETPEITAMVRKWLKAWSVGDIDAYARFYAEDFTSDGMNLEQWIERKQYLADQYEFIRITMKNPKVRKSGDYRIVTFVQNYQSSGHHAVGKKILTLKREAGQWKIYQETWRQM